MKLSSATQRRAEFICLNEKMRVGNHMKRLNMKQYNNVITGNILCAELPTDTPKHRAFLRVRAYTPGLPPSKRQKISKVLNRSSDDLHFRLEKYEVDISTLESWNDQRENYKEYVCIDNLSSIEELETELGKYLQDFSLLSWGSDTTPRP